MWAGTVEQVVNSGTLLQSRRLFAKGDEIRRHRGGDREHGFGR